MNKIKEIKLDQTNWLEATWVEEVITQVEGEEDRVETTQLWCESYSGHPEHIAMLRAKALEFETDLTDFEDLIISCQNKFEMPSEESIQAEITKNLVAEAKQYLLDTDWVIVKINEAQLLGQDIQPLLAKYSVELGEREAKRTIINSLEG